MMDSPIPYTVCRDSEGWLIASVPTLPGCHTQAKTEEELLVRLRDAVRVYLDALRSADLSPAEFVAVRELEV
ncbi:MAG: type II toxin-antitoxin system HicB family antitoxin [Fimbriimonadales bacterium]